MWFLWRLSTDFGVLGCDAVNFGRYETTLCHIPEDMHADNTTL